VPASRLNDATVVIGAGILLIAAGVAGAIIAPAPNPIDAGTSTFSAGPAGTKGAYLTLAELGYRVERSLEPLTALRTDPATVVVIISGQEAPSNQDRRALRELLQKGGVVIAAGAAGAALLDMTVPAGQPRAPLATDRFEEHRALLPSPLTAGAPRITMPADLVRPTLPGAFAGLYGRSADETTVATATVGSGRAVWWAAPTPISNEQIDEADNLQLLLNIAGSPGTRTIVFDEHYQGHRRSLWSYAAGTPLPWIALQTGLIMLAAFLTYSRRSGPIRAPHLDVRTSPMEFVDMLGALYKRARARHAAVAAARMRLRRMLAATCGVPAASTDDALARAAASTLGTDAGAIAELLAESERAAADPGLDAPRALDVTRRLQALAARLHAARRFSQASGGVN
jgi:hypothetical protein